MYDHCQTRIGGWIISPSKNCDRVMVRKMMRPQRLGTNADQGGRDTLASIIRMDVGINNRLSQRHRPCGLSCQKFRYHVRLKRDCRRAVPLELDYSFQLTRSAKLLGEVWKLSPKHSVYGSPRSDACRRLGDRSFRGGNFGQRRRENSTNLGRN